MPEGGDAIGNIPLDLPAERIERGLNLSDLARRSGLGRRVIQDIESGKAPGTPPTRAKIRKALDSVEPIRPAPVSPPDDGWRVPLQELAGLVVDLQRRLLDAEQQIHELRTAKRRRPPADGPPQ